MSDPDSIKILLLIAFFIAISLIRRYRRYLRSPERLGRVGEKRTQKLASRYLISDHFLYNDLLLPTAYGTTQVDHVILTKQGVFVLETKHYSGWIFGKIDQSKWTQVIFREKNQFQNPLRQNYKHVKAVIECLGVDKSTVHSVIVFSSRYCEFKTPMPPNVGNPREAFEHINSFKDEVFTPNDLIQLQRKLDLLAKQQTGKAKRQHVKELYERFDTSDGRCPKCGQPLVLRIAKIGRNSGSEFMGCSSYPKCKYTQPK